MIKSLKNLKNKILENELHEFNFNLKKNENYWENNRRVLTFNQNLWYIQERNVSIDFPKDFFDLLEKQKNPNDEKVF